MRIIFAFGEKLERERSPRSKMCHPERSEGSPPFNRGGEQTLLELYPKTKTEEMSHFVRHDGVSVVTPRRLCEESPTFNRGGKRNPSKTPL